MHRLANTSHRTRTCRVIRVPSIKEVFQRSYLSHTAMGSVFISLGYPHACNIDCSFPNSSYIYKKENNLIHPGQMEEKRYQNKSKEIFQPDLELTPSGYCSLTALQRNKKNFTCSFWKTVLYSHNKLLFPKHFPTGKHHHLKQILLHDCESNFQSFF